MMNKRIITGILIFLGLISIIGILIASINAINASEGAFKFLRLDFNGSDKIISSYSSFIGVILSFFTTLILIYTIIYQKWQYQTEQDDLKQAECNRERNELIEHLNLLNSLLEDLIKSIDYTANDILNFIKDESKYPLKQNMRPTYSRQNVERIVNVDYAKTYKAFREIIVINNMTELFKNMYSRIDFYAYALDDDASKSSYHIKDKAEKLKIIRGSLHDIVRKSTIVCHRYSIDYPEKANDMLEYKMLQKLFRMYNFILQNTPEDQFIVINEKLLKPFTNKVDAMVAENQFETDFILLFHEIHNVSSLIDELMIHVSQYIEGLKYVYQNYWDENNEHLAILKQTHLILSKQIHIAKSNVSSS